ncbi:MAG: zonular occludens toxin domain-containing protein [Atribacterota bacterium]
MIVLYKGARGRGKTLTMTKDALKYYNNGWRVYSNMEGLPFATYISPEDIMKIDKNSDLRDCVLVVDEVQVLFDSRASMRKENRGFSYFIQQIRKRGLIFLATTQFAGTVDLRFRQHVDIIAVPNFNKYYKVCEVEYIDITSQEDLEFLMTEPKSKKVLFDARPIFNLYNTKELII